MPVTITRLNDDDTKARFSFRYGEPERISVEVRGEADFVLPVLEAMNAGVFGAFVQLVAEAENVTVKSVAEQMRREFEDAKAQFENPEEEGKTRG